MVSKRPCRVCRKWFQPNPRVGKRQKVCSEPACQRERHRQNGARWRQRNADYDRGERLRERLRIETEPPAQVASEAESAAGAGPEANFADPKRCRVQINWPMARDVVGLELTVFIMELSEVLVETVRDEVQRQLLVSIGKFAGDGRQRRRDEIVET